MISVIYEESGILFTVLLIVLLSGLCPRTGFDFFEDCTTWSTFCAINHRKEWPSSHKAESSKENVSDVQIKGNAFFSLGYPDTRSIYLTNSTLVSLYLIIRDFLLSIENCVSRGFINRMLKPEATPATMCQMDCKAFKKWSIKRWRCSDRVRNYIFLSRTPLFSPNLIINDFSCPRDPICSPFGYGPMVSGNAIGQAECISFV